jgi:hypothetical protein
VAGRTATTRGDAVQVVTLEPGRFEWDRFVEPRWGQESLSDALVKARVHFDTRAWSKGYGGTRFCTSAIASLTARSLTRSVTGDVLMSSEAPMGRP